jgi:arylformamidase
MIYDISPPITPDLKVWPGDTPPGREVLLDMRKGDNVTLSTLRATAHLGAHADAPSHYDAEGESIGARSLHPYLGPCRVIGVDVGRGGLIMPDDRAWPAGVPRILLRTGTFPDPTVFNEDFAALSPELIDRLAADGARLVGIDTPSVDPFHSKDLPAHRACLRHDVAILEGLVLADVPDGLYELIALPLRLIDFDASPVRAVLRTLED